jgi:hypothetical protein
VYGTLPPTAPTSSINHSNKEDEMGGTYSTDRRDVCKTPFVKLKGNGYLEGLGVVGGHS